MADQAPNETIIPVGDFDGDGIVFRADVVRTKGILAPTVRLTLNGGIHATTVDLNAHDLGQFCALIDAAREAAISSLTRKPG